MLWLVIIVLGAPVIASWILFSAKRRSTFLHRLGLKPLPAEIRVIRGRRSDRKVLWIHALSVGEVLSAAALVSALKKNFKDFELLFSVSTQTGFEIARGRLKGQVQAVFFFPYDLFFSVMRAVRTVNPYLVVMVETDVWPNFMFALKRAGIPAILVNARISDHSLKNYKRFSYFSRRLFSRFTKICAQSGSDAANFKSLGVPARQIVMTGNIKFDQKFEPISRDEKENLMQMLHLHRPAKLFVAGSTHGGEEVILREAFLRIKKRFSDLMLVVVPRDPLRAGRVKGLFRGAGVESALVSELHAHESYKPVDVVVVDTIGLLHRLYGLADAAFIGGSLVGSGGHNPLEAAAYAVPILFGPDMTDFKEISRMLLDSGGAVEVKDVEELVQAVDKILGKTGQAALMGRRANEVFRGNQGALAHTLQVIEEAVRLRRESQQAG